MNRYNPNIHHRRSIRLKGYDYSKAGLYFITMNVKNNKYLFGEIENEEMMLNDYGFIAHNQWEKLPERFSNLKLDVFQIMPNHMHGIILLTETVGSGFTPDPNEMNTEENGAGVNPARTTNSKTVCDIVGAYKSLVANGCLEIFKQKFPEKIMGKLWQRNYWEHIIRNELSYLRISEYILANPKKWQEDKFYKKQEDKNIKK